MEVLIIVEPFEAGSNLKVIAGYMVDIFTGKKVIAGQNKFGKMSYFIVTENGKCRESKKLTKAAKIKVKVYDDKEIVFNSLGTLAFKTCDEFIVFVDKIQRVTTYNKKADPKLLKIVGKVSSKISPCVVKYECWSKSWFFALKEIKTLIDSAEYDKNYYSIEFFIQTVGFQNWYEALEFWLVHECVSVEKIKETVDIPIRYCNEKSCYIVDYNERIEIDTI